MPSHHSCLSHGSPLAGKAPAGITNGIWSTASSPLCLHHLVVLGPSFPLGMEIHLGQLDGLGTYTDHWWLLRIVGTRFTVIGMEECRISGEFVRQRLALCTRARFSPGAWSLQDNSTKVKPPLQLMSFLPPCSSVPRFGCFRGEHAFVKGTHQHRKQNGATSNLPACRPRETSWWGFGHH